MRHRLLALLGLALALGIAGCGDDKEKTVVEQRTVTDTVTDTTDEVEETTTTDTATVPSTGPTDCGNVSVDLGNGSEGGANSVEATSLDCEEALDVMRECIQGDVPQGWSVSGELGSPVLTRGSQKISGTLAGGGGCQPLD